MNKLVQKILGGRDSVHPAKQKQAVAARQASFVSYYNVVKGNQILTGDAIHRLVARRMYGV